MSEGKRKYRKHRNWKYQRDGDYIITTGRDPKCHGHHHHSHGEHHYHKEYMNYYGRHEEFTRYRRLLRFMPFVVLTIIGLTLFALYKWSGRENFATIVLVLFGLHVAKELIQGVFFRKISSRFIEPLIKMKQAFDSVADGDYSVRVDVSHRGDMRGLFYAFNDMVGKLDENERLKTQYEENRKMLVANISHDLKTPITTINGYLEVLEEGAITDPEKLKKYVHVMRNNTDYINRLVDDLFLYSKLDIDQVQFDFNRVHAKDFLGDMVEEFSMFMEDAGFEFEIEDNITEHTYLNIDGKMFHRALRNIIDNSVKYVTNAKSPKVSIGMQSTDKFISLKIKDNGEGIPEDKLPFIFNRFFRVDDERTKNLNSTGLGLAITKELIEAHSGRIVAGNQKNSGAIFVIQLPLVE